MVDRHARRVLLVRLLATTGVAMLGRAQAAARRAPAIGALLEWLPGRYRGPDSELEILPVYAPMTAPDAFYVREAAIDGSERLLAQQLLAVSPAKRGRAVLRVWRFADAARWREAHRTPDLFKGLMPGDVLPGPAAEVDWHPTEQRIVALRGAGFPFELDANAITFRARYEREGSGLP